MGQYLVGMGNRLIGVKPGDWLLEIYVPRVSKARKLPNGWIQLHRKALGGRARLRSFGFYLSHPPMDIDSGLRFLAEYARCGHHLRLRKGDEIIPGYLVT
jgi:hypothetical protein